MLARKVPMPPKNIICNAHELYPPRAHEVKIKVRDAKDETILSRIDKGTLLKFSRLEVTFNKRYLISPQSRVLIMKENKN